MSEQMVRRSIVTNANDRVEPADMDVMERTSRRATNRSERASTELTLTARVFRFLSTQSVQTFGRKVRL